MRLTATLPTARASQLLATAAKHFAHKVAVDQDETGARIAFPAGMGTMQIAPGGLSLAIESADPAAAENVREIFESHLLRFAHRDAPAALIWTQTVD